jgi:hypothetical protein
MPSYWTPFLPDQRLQLDPQWQKALHQAYHGKPADLIAYLRANTLTARHSQELADLHARKFNRRHGAKGNKPGSIPAHDPLHRLRTDIIAFTELGLQELRREHHGEVPYNGIRMVFEPIFEFFIQAYDHNLTAEQVAALKTAWLDEIRL